MRVNKIIETNKHYENKKRTEFIQKKQYTNDKKIPFSEVLKSIRKNIYKSRV
ncbi:hypothetical protein BD780_001741 [Clostridium tetanomorphum]|uniref:Uncharacterized protein n=1 Tax=Clostridium tetanomorphum TaxID=1553 RepID=A0A923J2E9_CLOTT|nr:hypothetical protein [Clostridium tetanomorphum]MBC2398620.1 hypothetical protein [Clostridium tetanomorphum]MBP1864103.1 hypothetical protein [Clostridium tetanomorphum]NRS84516.1 hypothetical protein [Clostridium tetanomorphum]NRZ97730.1 hypothetical protein [Clostridium tetanomorphum]